ncbi:MAG: hypothetical protein ABIT08_08555 [Bacteroidia bacterium]
MESSDRQLKISEYSITGDPDLTDDGVSVVPEIMEILQRTHKKPCAMTIM